MAGIYIHIPFCKTKCHYCDFYSSTSLNEKKSFLSSLEQEILLRTNYLAEEHVDSIYIGGGTPSLLSIDELIFLFEKLHDNFLINPGAEVTLECNPDDLSEEYLKAIYHSPVNRLSIGIQSFRYEDLKQMKLGVQHISAYHLTYHEGTVFQKWLKEGKIAELSEDESFGQFKMLRDRALENGYEHYEISNFALPGFYSRHNTAYWNQQKYIGLGPSAHSFDLNSRQWNVSDLKKYEEGVNKGHGFFEVEYLSKNDRFNDYILTSLRTKWGISFCYIEETFGEEYLSYVQDVLQKYQDTDLIELMKDYAILSEEGLFVSDKILTDLMRVN